MTDDPRRNELCIRDIRALASMVAGGVMEAYWARVIFVTHYPNCRNVPVRLAAILSQMHAAGVVRVHYDDDGNAVAVEAVDVRPDGRGE